MAVAAKNTGLLIEQYSFTGDTNSLSIVLTTPPLDSTGFGVAAHTFIPYIPSIAMSMNGYYTGKAAGDLEKEMNDSLGSATYVTLAALFGTHNVACPAYIVPAAAWLGQMTFGMPIDGLVTLAGEWPSQNGFKRGIRVFNDTLSATGVQTAYDLGAQGTAGGDAYLFVTAITGTATNATIDVESSATEGGVYVSEGTFTFSAVGVVAIALSGTVDRWVRLNCTSLGGATNFTVQAIVCVDGVTQ